MVRKLTWKPVSRARDRKRFEGESAERKAEIEQHKEEETKDFALSRWECPEDYIPGEKTLPDDGAWIQIIFPPHAEITVEHLSVWYALPAYPAEDWNMFLKHEKLYKVKIITPIGELMLYPHEYNVIKTSYLMDLLAMIDSENHVKINWLDARHSDFDTDKLFYILSKGIPKGEAYKMLMGEVKSQNVCFLTMHTEYQKMFAGVGVPKLGAKRAVESHINFVLMEKAAGRWYQTKDNSVEIEIINDIKGDNENATSTTKG